VASYETGVLTLRTLEAQSAKPRTVSITKAPTTGRSSPRPPRLTASPSHDAA
jgi:hypothetical protein